MTRNPIVRITRLVSSEERDANGKLEAEIPREFHGASIRLLRAYFTSRGKVMKCSVGAIQGLGSIAIKNLETSVIERQLHRRPRNAFDWTVVSIQQAA